MTTLLITMLLIVAVAAGGCFAYARTLRASDTQELSLPPVADDGQHNAQLYWRELEQAHDWDGLKVQLRRWHKLANPGWDEAQIEEVTRALNRAVFRFAEPVHG